jgi:hypothetical protein
LVEHSLSTSKTLLWDASQFVWSGSLSLSTSDLTIGPGAQLRGNGGGYASANSPPVAACTTSGRAYGGAHGGNTKSYDYAYPTYSGFATGCGSYREPELMGASGGASYSSSYSPGAGGGAIHVTATRVELNGTLSVNGAAGSNYGSNSCGRNPGGGAGGSIWVEAASFSGTGLLRANGNRGGAYNTCCGGGGSGGRVAVHVSGASTFTGSYQARGYDGNSRTKCNGPAGTVFTSIVGAELLSVAQSGTGYPTYVEQHTVLDCNFPGCSFAGALSLMAGAQLGLVGATTVRIRACVVLVCACVCLSCLRVASLSACVCVCVCVLCVSACVCVSLSCVCVVCVCARVCL